MSFKQTTFVASMLVLLSWFVFVFLVSAIVCEHFFQLRLAFVSERYMEIGGFFVILGLITGIFIFLPSCPVCSNRIFNEQRSYHPKFHSIKGLGGWASIVVRVIIKREFRCMHCGTKHSV